LVEADLGQLKRELRDYYGDAAINFVTRNLLINNSSICY